MEPIAQNEPPKRYMDVRELSVYLGLSKWMIYKLIDSRAIPFIPFGRVIRFDRQAVDRWTEKRSVPAAPDKTRKRPERMEPIRPSNRIGYAPVDDGAGRDGAGAIPSTPS